MGVDDGTSRTSAQSVQVVRIHDSARTRVSRLSGPGGGFILKEPVGPGAGQRLRQESAILDRLSGVDGVVQLAREVHYPGSIPLTDVGGVALADIPTPLDPTELIRLALPLARAVDGMHGRGVVHRDINPANILVTGSERAPYLIDFALATTFAEIRTEFTHHREVVGTLPYLAPEQSGRTARLVDQRADLYALGATLYHLATGAPPFGSGDPLRLIHDHLARVPAAPAEVNPAVPAALSAIIMHLLEKEPDDRYQTAAGLSYDLRRLRDGTVEPFSVGTRDFPPRLLAPSRLFGRDEEIAALHSTFTLALSRRCRGLLVTGAPGVGKTSLVDELRSIVTGSDGWFVSGKFDQYRRDPDSDGVYRAFRALGRLLLAEPEKELADLRERILRVIGPNAGLASEVVPELAALLELPPDVGDPQTVQARAQRNAVDILRVIASRKRPVVFVVDDLQWAPRAPLGFVDEVFSDDEPAEGLLLVAVYREGDVDTTHPLAPMLARWRRQEGVDFLRLDNLPTTSLAGMVGEMLHLDPPRAAELAGLIAPRTGGNAYETVELLNALRVDGALTLTDHGWSWDGAALRQLDQADVAGLLTERAEAMPAPTRALLEAMACLGGWVEIDLLREATGRSTGELEELCLPALDGGLLVAEPGPYGHHALCFRHDRNREDLLRRVKPGRLDELRLRLARRLAARPELRVIAAEQYLPVIDAVRDPVERRGVVDLLRGAAERAGLVSNHALVERLLGAAVRLTDPDDTDSLIELYTGRQAALYNLGRLDEADEVYQAIDRLCTEPAQRIAPTLVQVSSLTNQPRPREAVALGVGLLRQLGIAVPTAETIDADVDRRLDELCRWLERESIAEQVNRQDITDPTLLGAMKLINRLMPAAFTCDRATMAWLVLEAVRMWVQHGPVRSLLEPISDLVFVTATLRGDYGTGARVLGQVLAASATRDHEPEASQAGFVYALAAGPWFAPLEDTVRRAQTAREGLIRGGDLQHACYTYVAVVQQLFEFAPQLDTVVEEIESGLAFAVRTGNEIVLGILSAYRWLIHQLRGEGGTDAQATLLVEATSNVPPNAAQTHIIRALAAAVFDDQLELERRSQAATEALASIEGMYPTALAHLLRGMALAGQARAAAPDQRGGPLAALDAEADWLRLRAADAPANFRHLLRLVEAERAWSAGDHLTAARAFDAARREVSARRRPWHQAFILERAARFHLAYGIEQAGCELLVQARDAYQAWGATAKVSQLDWAYPARRSASAAPPNLGDVPVAADAGTRRSSIPTGALDLLGILAASQALSSETSIDGLRTRVADVLSAMTGATDVHLLLWNAERRQWSPSARATRSGAVGGDEEMIALGEPCLRRLVPLSVVRYVERTHESLVVTDATHDDRFARDPYLADLSCCSLLAVPIFNRGALRALLLLENRLLYDAFSTDRLDGVMLIAGQLAVSLDNSLVYASLEHKVAERTRQLAIANRRLKQLSVTDPLTGLANRRQLEEILTSEWQRAQRSGRPLAIAMVDVDHFKLYNDHYGHAAGDKCLRRVAGTLADQTRTTDLAARYGGEEFAIVMPDTDTTTAHHIAERLRAAIAAFAEPHPLATNHIVTVSVGVAAAVPPPNSFAQSLVETADAELYRAKRAGRNRVQATGPTCPPSRAGHPSGE
ncbi:diguanylate cyclase [Pseudofrankia sp. BMG5.36]|uniref:diguanylate cyclase n=1 Tax=Pseudofrankia sp. BMG5.36 TaxID=1834512 RepID=UPI0008DB14BF|nr:diguanylate cyclase [Pseudofrankia sp. BMG5.36]OHV64706.1 serine/threonine protein kinase [Pseudofrankia sp. BMG5.36]